MLGSFAEARVTGPRRITETCLSERESTRHDYFSDTLRYNFFHALQYGGWYCMIIKKCSSIPQNNELPLGLVVKIML